MSVNATRDVDAVYAGNNKGAVVSLPVNVPVSQTGLSLVAAAGAGLKIKVVGLQMQSGGTATNITFNSASTAKTPLMALGINQHVCWPNAGGVYFETVANEALTVTTGTGSTTGVLIQYVVAA